MPSVSKHAAVGYRSDIETPACRYCTVQTVRGSSNSIIGLFIKMTTSYAKSAVGWRRMTDALGRQTASEIRW